MLIGFINLDNVKCFGPKIKLDLCVGKQTPHKWVVIYGDNGLGKSTLLKAFGIALTGQPALNALLPSAEGWGAHRKPRAMLHVFATKGSGDKSPGYPRARGINVVWELIGYRHAKNADGEISPAHSIALLENNAQLLPERGSRTAAKYLDDDVKLFKEHISADDPKRGWFICGYGAHRRLSGAASEMSERIPPDGRAARLVTLFHEKAALTSAERWLRTLHHHASIENEKNSPAQRRLDAHLHPSWQRTIGAWLHERFPNIQFIVATHSPLIATRVSESEGMVIRLVRRKKGKGEVVEAICEEGTIGLTADQKLTSPNFGLTSTRDVLADGMAADIARLREQARSSLTISAPESLK